jgi:hypothetical protein
VPGGVQGDDGKDRQHPEHVDGEKAGHGPDLTAGEKNVPVESCWGGAG